MPDITYHSIFKKEFQDLVDLKKALGFEYTAEAAAFKRVDTFFTQNELTEKIALKDLCDIWCRKKSYESISNQSHRISTMRVFCRYLNDIGIQAYVPPKGITKKSPKYEAHIYSDDELKRFFAEVDKSRSIPGECPYRGFVMPVFFRILYTSGMRVSELRRITVGDMNLEDGYITVRNAKNHKDRIVPVHPQLIEKCRMIQAEIHAVSPDDEYFFMIRPRQAMTLVNVYRNFRRYLEHAGIPHTGHGPRVHDFRYPYINKIRTIYQKPDDQRKLQAKGSDNFYRFIARTPQNVDKLPSALRHFLGADLSFSSSSVANAFASCSVVMSKYTIVVWRWA